MPEGGAPDQACHLDLVDRAAADPTGGGAALGAALASHGLYEELEVRFEVFRWVEMVRQLFQQVSWPRFEHVMYQRGPRRRLWSLFLG